jgi:hypothetical protein
MFDRNMKAIQVLSLVSYIKSAAVASLLKSSSTDSQCGAQKDFFDSNGNDVKTACILYSPQTQDSACSNINMNLFVIDSVESNHNCRAFLRVQLQCCNQTPHA